jgi:superkiller protein 3
MTAGFNRVRFALYVQLVLLTAVACAPRGSRELNTATALYQDGRYAEAAAEYRKAIKLQPSWAAAYVGLGNALAEQREVDAAVTAYTRAVELRPDWAEAHLSLGRCLVESHRWSDAIAPLRSATSLTPADARGHILLGIVFVRLNNLPQALASFKTGEVLCSSCFDSVAAQAYAEARSMQHRSP